MKTKKITNRTIMFTTRENEEYDVNLGLILGEKHNFVIDTGMGSGSVAPILEYIGEDAKPIIVVNTHSHWDHTFGNCMLENSTIISHILCRERLDKGWDGEAQEYIKKNREYIEGEVRKCLPNMVFEGSLCFPEEGISIFHSPGHREDCISVYDAVDKVLYTGDNFGVREGRALLWGEDLFAFQRLIETYKQYDFDICLSGHSEPQTKEVIALLETALAEAQRKHRD